jgi:hypothetical protein
LWYAEQLSHVFRDQTCLQTKPLEGAESGGAVGFFKGFGKGLVG